ncbi:GmrSD restriction endonuclease domain-containing protein [Amycolatopsis keratiniphila]|uniref:GmrSD restriction endonucleases C-terminal domain-containing protein n=1 Tax=Amycolatopsis keratiniphila TaxID=129921 RepID=W6HWD1_9PSEU|nr:DUF1524 domain-containing protein [Amycolatopsis keratiniphila]AHJ58530.1 hypothetical protein AORI_P015 [Amycolatopsis keratiniphila]
MTTATRIRPLAGALLTAAVLTATAACAPGEATVTGGTAALGASSSTSTPSPAAAPDRMPTTPAETLALLKTLRIAPEDTGAHYDRDDWKHWIPQPSAGKGCNTREMILIQQGRNETAAGHAAVTRDPATCEPLAGHGNIWHSLYDNVTVTDPAALDVDHVVPLEQMTRSGTRGWTAAQRQAYANDPDVLVAVTAKSNRQKGSKDPAKWMPSNPEVRFEYLRTWVFVKATFKVAVDQAEHDAIAGMLRHMPKGR